MRQLTLILIICATSAFVLYLLLPNPEFPLPLPDAVQSMEPADSETQLRRAYFTNYSREEVIAHYKKQFSNTPILRLNYPPEDAQTIIRDQARSTFLEELSHPFRESLYINGFEPKEAKDDIWYKGNHYRQKITIRYAPSNVVTRLFVALLIFLICTLLWKEIFRKVKHA